MEGDELEPYDGGASSVERRGSEPLCTFDPQKGFAINASTVDELRWYTYLSPDEGEEETLLQSRNDD